MTTWADFQRQEDPNSVTVTEDGYVVDWCEKCGNKLEVPEDHYWDAHSIICSCGHCTAVNDPF